MEEDDGTLRTPPSLIPSTTKYTMTNSVVVLLVYLIPSANIRVLLLIVIIDYFVFLPHPPPSLASKKGLHLSPKSSLLRREDLKPGRPGLYEQTSSRPYGVARNCLRNRIASVLRNRVAIVYAPMARLRDDECRKDPNCTIGNENCSTFAL